MVGTSVHALGPVVFAAGRYLHWGVIQISLANLVIILVMIAIFVLALLLPFPRGRDEVAENRDRVSRHGQSDDRD